MKAIVLAAGRGKRMRHLTEHTAKPLLKLWGRAMIDWQLERLARGGIREAVVNTAHHSELFPEHFAQNPSVGIRVLISKEGDSYAQALETRGGIVRALPLLSDGEEPFIVVSGDVMTDFDYARLEEPAARIRKGEVLAHLVLVPNPSFKVIGDMSVKDGLIVREPKEFTYGNIAVFSPKLFEGQLEQFAPLFPWLYEFADEGKVSGEIFRGAWANVGTPEDLAYWEAKGSFFAAG